MKNIYFIINPQAKNGYCLKVWRRLEKILKEQEVYYQSFMTKYIGHAKEIAQSIARNEEEVEKVIVAVGGDGTINEVVNGVAPFKNVKIAYIPGGSGNDFSRGFGIPKNPTAALMNLLHGMDEESTLVDWGKIENEDRHAVFFINNMGVGFDAKVAKEANRSRIKKFFNKFSLGKLAYVYLLIKNAFSYQLSDIEMKIDGKKYSYDSVWFVTVSNQPYYGGGMKISPDASPHDGMLNITVVTNLSRLKLLLLFITVFWGGHVALKEVKTFTGRDIRISSSQALYVHADGEDIGSTTISTITCLKSLPILAKACGE